jgi:hypothetical protein
MSEAKDAAAHVGIANVIFPMRSPDMQKKIADALPEAGLPD